MRDYSEFPLRLRDRIGAQDVATCEFAWKTALSDEQRRDMTVDDVTDDTLIWLVTYAHQVQDSHRLMTDNIERGTREINEAANAKIAENNRMIDQIRRGEAL